MPFSSFHAYEMLDSSYSGDTKAALLASLPEGSGDDHNGTGQVPLSLRSPLPHGQASGSAPSRMMLGGRLENGAILDFVAEWLVTSQHLVFVRRRRLSEAGLDTLQIVLRWVEADVDAVAYTETLSQSGDYTFPTSSFLSNRTVGVRVPLSGAGNASLIRCLVCLPTSASGASVARMVALTINDSTLTADNVVTGSISSASGQGVAPSIITSAWTPGLEMLSTTGVAWIMERLGSGLYRCTVTATGLTVTNASLVGPSRQLGLAFAQGKCLSVAEFSGQFSISADSDLVLRIPIDALSTRVDGFEWTRFSLWSSDQRMVSLSPVTALPRGMAIYPWGHCVSARSPVYGAWMARSAPPPHPRHRGHR